PIIMALTIAVIAFVIRVDYASIDQYLLSEAWYTDLYHLHGLENAKIWDPFSTVLIGEYYLIHLFANLMGLPLYMALCTFGILQIILLGFIVFWTINEMSDQHYYSGFL